MTTTLKNRTLYLTFIAISLFYFFEFAQMSYFNALAPSLLSAHLYTHHQIGALSAAYYYGNVMGLLPAGYILDHFRLRRAFLFAILGSVCGALLLAATTHYPLALLARFICGFFGGTFSFVGGIRILVNLFQKRFALFMGMFLTAGMLGGAICQYPVLWLSHNFSPRIAIFAIFLLGVFILLFNSIWLRPDESKPTAPARQKTHWQDIKLILKNYRNWSDCFLIVFLDSPFTILGTLWGVITLTKLYHFSAGTSAMIISVMFIGSIIGSLAFGILSDRYHNDKKLVLFSTTGILLLLLLLIMDSQLSAVSVAFIFLLIGFLTGAQTIVFSWLTKNMRPELVGRNSAMNSMLFMGAGGVFKQVGAVLLSTAPFISSAHSASSNLLLLIAIAMFVSSAYVILRKRAFQKTVE